MKYFYVKKLILSPTGINHQINEMLIIFLRTFHRDSGEFFFKHTYPYDKNILILIFFRIFWVGSDMLSFLVRFTKNGQEKPKLHSDLDLIILIMRYTIHKMDKITSIFSNYPSNPNWKLMKWMMQKYLSHAVVNDNRNLWNAKVKSSIKKRYLRDAIHNFIKFSNW